MNRKWAALALKLAVSGALIWFLLANMDLADAAARLVQVSPVVLLIAGVGFIVQMVLGAGRWETVMKAIGSPLPFAKAVEIFYVGAFFSQALPGSVGGDAVRMYKAYQLGHVLPRAVNGVILERVATVFALVLLVAAVQPFFLPMVGDEEARWIVPAVFVFLALTLGGLAVVMFLDRLPPSLHRWRAVRGLAYLGADAHKMFLRPGPLVRVLAWSLLGHVNLTLIVFVLGLGLGLEITWLDCLALFPPVVLVTTLPVSIAGWGVREGAMVAAFSVVGVPVEGAFALSILVGLMSVVMSLPGGLIWLVGSDSRRDVARAHLAEAVGAAAPADAPRCASAPDPISCRSDEGPKT